MQHNLAALLKPSRLKQIRSLSPTALSLIPSVPSIIAMPTLPLPAVNNSDGKLLENGLQKQKKYDNRHEGR